MLLVALRDALWGMPLISLLLISGGYFSIRLGFFQLHPIRILQNTLGSLRKQRKNRKAMLAAVSTALGGTVGIGSITGVAYGIAVGGAGSLFWMWVSGFFGMALKYTEVFLAVKHRKKTKYGYVGGAPYALRDMGYKKLGVLFALLCVFSSFGVGNLTQIGALTQVTSGLGISPLLCGGGCAALLAFAVWGGRERIGRWNTVLVPLASLLYLLVTVGIVIAHLPLLPGVFARILQEAFGLDAAFGGISGSLMAIAMREGFARGIFSNEAGVGSSPLAHASSGEGDPVRQGEWGGFEILMDTFVVSTVTGLALLCTEFADMTKLFGFAFGKPGVVLFAVLVAIFAFASILSWCYYSEVCLQFLALPHGETVYRILCVGCALAGACLSMDTIWILADLLGGLMIFPNLFLLFQKRNEVIYLQKKGTQRVVLTRKRNSTETT